ncbi:MAG: hypothetical protein RI894_757 [Bacteroidota bacterium]|jgi:catechol 2,3-dioxygenase-like lactoylglutathione lyase family enzyme
MTFRLARHTDDFQAIIFFYTHFLGFELLGSFENHAGYDGIFLGKKGLDWHLEFTKSAEKAVRRLDDDDILVFYPASEAEYHAILNRFSGKNVLPISIRNPYWQENGRAFSDPDGFPIIISPLKIKKTV